MRYLLVLAFVAVGARVDGSSVVFFDDVLVTNRDDAIDMCMGRGRDMCIGHSSQMESDLIGRTEAIHTQCGITWDRDNAPRKVVCDKRDEDHKCIQASSVKCDKNEQEKWGYYCHQHPDGKCSYEDIDEREVFPLKEADGKLRKFSGIGEASAACEELNGSKLAEWHHVFAFVTRYRVSDFQADYYILTVPHAVYQFHADGKVKWQTHMNGEKYPTFCVGRISKEVVDPCEGDNPLRVFGGREISCVAPHGSDKANWILAQERVPCEDEQYDFTEYARGRHHWINGFGEAGQSLFLGLQRMHALTNARDCKLRIEFKNDTYSGVQFIEYDYFKIHGKESTNAGSDLHKICRYYRFEVSNTASSRHPPTLVDNFNKYPEGALPETDNNQFFSDMEHDCDSHATVACSGDETLALNSAWWMGACTNSNLNGRCENSIPANQPYNKRCKYWYSGSPALNSGCLTETRMLMKCHTDTT